MAKSSILRRFVELYVVTFGVFEGRDAAPGVLRDAGRDIDAVVLEGVYGLLQAGLWLEGYDGAALDACSGGLAAVEAYREAVGVYLGPVSVLIGDLEFQSVPVEAFGPLDVLDGHPDYRYA